MSEEFQNNIEEDSTSNSSVSGLIFYIILLIISLFLLIVIIIFMIKKIKLPKRKIQRSNSITPNIHFKTEDPPSLNSRNEKITSNNRQSLEMTSNTDKTTENRFILESRSLAPPKLNNNSKCEDIEISKTFNSEEYTENEESNEDKMKQNDVVVISDITTKTTNM